MTERATAHEWKGDKEEFKPSSIKTEEQITVGQLFKNTVKRCPDHPALKYKEDGAWKAISYKHYYDQCIVAAKSFLKVGVYVYGTVCLF